MNVGYFDVFRIVEIVGSVDSSLRCNAWVQPALPKPLIRPPSGVVRKEYPSNSLMAGNIPPVHAINSIVQNEMYSLVTQKQHMDKIYAAV